MTLLKKKDRLRKQFTPAYKLHLTIATLWPTTEQLEIVKRLLDSKIVQEIFTEEEQWLPEIKLMNCPFFRIQQ